MEFCAAATVSCSNDAGVCSTERWDEDRLVVATQVQNLLVAMRSNERFGARARFLGPTGLVEHPLLHQLRALQRKVTGPSSVRPVTEEAILHPFCDIWVSGEMGYTIIGTAMTCLSNMVEFGCTFITAKGVQKVLQSAQCAVGGSEDDVAYEDLLLQRLRLCVICLRHPSARVLPETFFIEVIRRAFVIALHPDTSQLLRRVAQETMRNATTAVFGWVIGGTSSLNSGQGSAEDVESCQSTASSDDARLSGVPTLRYICSLIDGSVSEIKDGRFNEGMFGLVSDSSLIVATQLEGLHLAQVSLSAVKDHLCAPGCGRLIYSVQHHLCRALLVAGVRAEDISLLSEILSVVHVVFKVASCHILPQTFSFMKALHLDPLVRIGNGLRTSSFPSRGGSTSMAPQHAIPAAQVTLSNMLDLCERRELILESLVRFCTDPKFAVFCYAHYDLSRRFPSLLEQICALLVENCFYYTGGNVSPGCGSVGHREFLSDIEVGTPLTRMDALALEAIKGLLWQVSQAAPHSGVPVDAKATAIISARVEQKRLLAEFASLFRSNAAKSGIPYLLRHATRLPAGTLKRMTEGSINSDIPVMVLEEPAGGREVGACLYCLSGLLDKRALGDFLGELGREKPQPNPEECADYEAAMETWMEERRDDHLRVGSVRYHEEQLKGFLQSFDYRGKPLLSSIRETAYRMCMPGEAQKIDRVMEVFSKTWLEANRDAGKDINPFSSEQGPFVLSFSLIMLNTDQHSGKMSRPMTHEDFRRMHRDSDGGNSLPEGYLKAVFDDVKAHPIIMAEMMDTGFSNDVTWSLEMQSPWFVGGGSHDPFRCVSMRSLTASAPEPCEVEALQPFILSMMWNHCLTAFGNALAGCTKSLLTNSKEAIQEGVAANPDLAAQLTTPEYAHNCALDGLCLLATAARDRGMKSLVDRVILTILSQLPVDLDNMENAVVQLVSQPSALLCLERVFRVMDDCFNDVLDAWEKLGCLFSNFFLLGLFSRDVTSLPEATPLPAELYANPRVVTAEVDDTQVEGGWLFTLWGSPAGEGRIKGLREQKEQEALDCVRLLLPTMEEFLMMIDRLDTVPHERLFLVLCEEARRRLRQKTSGSQSSHLLVLVTEVAVRRPADASILDHYVKLCQHVTSHYFTHECLIDFDVKEGRASGEGTSTKQHQDSVERKFEVSVGCGDIPTGAVRSDEWLASTTRVVKAILRAAICFASSDASRHVFLPLLGLLTAAPSAVFCAAVAHDLSATFLELIKKVPWLVDSPCNVFLKEILSALSFSFTAHPNITVQRHVEEALRFVVREALYDPLNDRESIVNVLVTCALHSSKVREECCTSADGGVEQESVKDVDGFEQDVPAESFIGNLVLVCQRFAVTHVFSEPPANGARRPEVWIAALKGLSTLVAMCRQNRDRNMALLCLQRSLLDVEVGSLSAGIVVLVFDNVIFPLMERTCAPLSDPTAPCGEGYGGKGGRAVGKAPPQVLPRQFSVTSILSSLAPAPASRRAMQAAAQQSQNLRDKHREVVDLRCRVISLSSKVFLHHVRSLEEDPMVLHELWQRVLGTLCALYSSLTAGSGASIPNGEAAPSDAAAPQGASHSESTSEDSIVLREAIQESVRNMIYVLASALTTQESTLAAEQVQRFWVSTKKSFAYL